MPPSATRRFAELVDALELFFDACERHRALEHAHPDVLEAFCRLCESAHATATAIHPPRTENTP